MNTVVTGRWREPVIDRYPTTREMIAWARCRPLIARTELPVMGEILGWRALASGPTVRARVLTVDLDPPTDTRAGSTIDSNVWRYVVHDPQAGPVMRDALGNRAVELVEDPWPTVLLATLDGPRLRVETREARLPGSPGWLREGE